MDHHSPYAGAPSIVSEMGTVITMAAALTDRSTPTELHELAVRRSAVLDRVALDRPGDMPANTDADTAAIVLLRLVARDRTPALAWTDPAGWPDPRAYARVEYTRWAAANRSGGDR